MRIVELVATPVTPPSVYTERVAYKPTGIICDDEVSGMINENASIEKFHEPEGIKGTPGSPGLVWNRPNSKGPVDPATGFM
jgi:hypothetical protein